jgi:hypothetical protein
LNIKKAAREIEQLLGNTPFPGRTNISYRDILSDQLYMDGTWDDKLIDSIKDIIMRWMKKLSTDSVKNLWSQSDASQEHFGEAEINIYQIKEELSEELFNMILDSLEDNSQDDDNLPGSKKQKRNYYDDEDFEDFDLEDSYDRYDPDYDDDDY